MNAQNNTADKIRREEKLRTLWPLAGEIYCEKLPTREQLNAAGIQIGQWMRAPAVANGTAPFRVSERQGLGLCLEIMRNPKHLVQNSAHAAALVITRATEHRRNAG